MAEIVELRSQIQKEKPRARKQRKREPTQEERLAEAKYTVELNKLSLQRLIQIEEEVKQKARNGQKRNTLDDYAGPVVTFYSREDVEDGKPIYVYRNLEIAPYKEEAPTRTF
jgi:hypothetical protein